MTGQALKLIAFVLPLGLDTFGVALALGVAGLPARQRNRVALLFAGFEAGMPLIGVALGVPLGKAIGGTADYLAAALVIALGVHMLIADGEEDTGRLLTMTRGGVYGAVALGVSISLDELAIGFSVGLLRLPLPEMIVAIALQAFILTQVGVRVGARVGERFRESAEQLAGIALIALGVALVLTRLV